MHKQTTLKKFVLPLLLILVSQSLILPSQNDKEDFSRFILQISLTQTFPERISMKKGHKSADWFIKKSKRGKPQKLEHLINKTLSEKAAETIQKLYSQGVKVGIDITKIPVYSKSKSKFITHGNAESGTTSFYQFLGFSIIERQLKFPISFHLMNKDDFSNISDVIGKTLNQIKSKIKIKLVIMDRGFISSKIVQTLQNLECSFIIAFRKSKKFNQLFKALEDKKISKREQFYFPRLQSMVFRKGDNCWLIKDYSYGNPQVKVNLVIYKVKKSKYKLKKDSEFKNEYFMYIASPDVSVEKVYSLYGTRWRIETAFRQIKDLQAKTRVINPCHRIWLFGVACLIYASWIYRHLPEDEETVFPEELLTKELQMMYREWTYKRTPIHKLVTQYLTILDQHRSLYL